jgi:hypothetical protein
MNHDELARINGLLARVSQLEKTVTTLQRKIQDFELHIGILTENLEKLKPQPEHDQIQDSD